MKYFCLIFIVIAYHSISIKVINPSLKTSINIDNNYNYQNIELRDLTNLLKKNILLTSIIKDNFNDLSKLESIGDHQYRSLCISHRDTNPSMQISDKLGLYHCFSCGESGDIISYIRKVKNTSYIETLKYCTNLLREKDNEIRYCLDNEPNDKCIHSVIKILENREIHRNNTLSSLKISGSSSPALLPHYINKPSPSSTKIVKLNEMLMNITTTHPSGEEGELNTIITQQNKRILFTLKCASIYYTSHLLHDTSNNANIVRKYLQSRYISPLTAIKFQLGYAPNPISTTSYGNSFTNNSHNNKNNYINNNNNNNNNILKVPQNIHNIYRFNKLHYKSDIESMNSQEKYRILNIRLQDWVTNTTFKVIPQPPPLSSSSSSYIIDKQQPSTKTLLWVKTSKLRLDMMDLFISGLVIDRNKYYNKNNNITNISTAMTNISVNESNFYERFRDRLMIPIRDINGTTIGFGGRILPTSSSSTSTTTIKAMSRRYKQKPLAKYINSPSSTVFKKSNALFGIDLAHLSIKKLDAVVIVEGYFDVICMHELGITNVVAVLGTSITTSQLIYASTLTKSGTVILLMDSDLAGQNAAERVKEKIMKNKHNIITNNISLYSTTLLHANNYIIKNMLQPRKEKIIDVLVSNSNTTSTTNSTSTTTYNNNKDEMIIATSSVNYTSLVSQIKDCSDVYTWFDRSNAIKIMNFVLNSRSLCIKS